jgi:hypothetical protein
MGLAGILGTHLVLCDVLARYGTDDRSGAGSPALAKVHRGGICLSGRTPDRPAVDHNGRAGAAMTFKSPLEMWVTNGRCAVCFSC